MEKNVSVILHWNTDYAEIPRKELPKVVELSYEPMIKTIEDWNDGTICFNITGHTFEYLEKNNPELVNRVKNLVKNKTVEMLATGYSHPILPLIPRMRVKAQLVDHLAYLKKLFGVKPKGIWPPELAVSPSVLDQIKSLGIEWTAVDYEHFLLSQHFGNDRNPFARREKTITEILAVAFWSKGLRKLREYIYAFNKLMKTNLEHNDPLQRVKIANDKDILAYLCSVSWSNSSQFAIGRNVAIASVKKHLKQVLKANTKMLSLYNGDIEFFGYREHGVKPAKPSYLTDFLTDLKKHNVNTISPSQIPTDEWPKDSSYLSAGSWADDKSFRIWTDSEDNSEYLRRADEIYLKLSSLNWDTKVMTKVEPYLRIFENSDPRGWEPLPERKDEAYAAMDSVFEILEKL